MRVQGAPIWSRTFQAAGMAPTVIAYNEVYNAIQNGVIAAGENEAAGVEQMKFYEVAPHLSMTQHAITIRPLCFSGKTFKKLDKDLQAAVLKAGKEAGAYGRQIESSEDEAKLVKMEKEGKLKRVPFAGRDADEEAGRPGDGGVRQGDRRRADPGQDQRDQVTSRGGNGGAGRVAVFYVQKDNALVRARCCRGCSPRRWRSSSSRSSLQIFSRYTALIPSYIWTEEMARFFFIWSIMLGAMVGIREGTHFVVDLWPPLNARAQAAIRLVASVFVLVFAFVFLWWGIDFTRFAFNRISELAELPLWYIHLPWPLAGITWGLFLGEQMWDDLRIVAGKLPPPAARPADQVPGSIS